MRCLRASTKLNFPPNLQSREPAISPRLQWQRIAMGRTYPLPARNVTPTSAAACANPARPQLAEPCARGSDRGPRQPLAGTGSPRGGEAKRATSSCSLSQILAVSASFFDDQRASSLFLGLSLLNTVVRTLDFGPLQTTPAQRFTPNAGASPRRRFRF